MKKKMNDGNTGLESPVNPQAGMPALLPASEHKAVPYALVRPDPNQPRKNFPEASLEEMADSIRQRGIVQALILEALSPEYEIHAPDLLNGKWKVTAKDGGPWEFDTEAAAQKFVPGDFRLQSYFRIVCGERRWRAAGIVGLTELPARVFPELSPEQRFALQMIENTQRENVSALEEAAAMLRQLEERRRTSPEFSPELLAAELGMSRAAAYERLKLNRLQPKIREALEDGTISMSIAQEVAKLPTPKLQQELLKRIKEQSQWNPMSVRQVQQTIDREFVKPLGEAPFDVKQSYNAEPTVTLTPCQDCPHRTANMLAEFPELKSRPNVCTNLECYLLKVKVANELKAKDAELKGITTITEREFQKQQDKFIKAEDTNYNSGGCQTWGKLMGKHKPKPVLVLGEDGPLEVYKKDEAQLALKANGVKLRGGADSSKEHAEQLKRQKKEKEFKTAAGLAAEQIFKVVVQGHDQPLNGAPLWRMLARAVYDLSSIEQCDFVAKRRGLSERCNDSRPALQNWLESEPQAPECAKFILEMLVIAMWSSGSYREVEWDEDFLALCKLAGGTPEKLAAAAEAELAKAKQTENQQLMEGIGAVEVKPPKKSLAAKLEKAKAKLPVLNAQARLHKLSAAARAHIAAAAKARWAKIKAAKT